MLNPQDDIGADTVALPCRNIFAAPSDTSIGSVPSGHAVFDHAAGGGANPLTGHDNGVARAGAWRRRVPAAARLVPAAAIAGVVVVLLAAGGPPNAAPLVPKRPPAQATPTQGHRARPLDGPRPAAREALRRPTRSKVTRGRPERSHAHRRHTARPSPRVAAPRPTPAPLAPSATPQAPRPAKKPAPVPASSPPEFM